MEHAWLDSLSEDWVSQPGSDASFGGAGPATAPSRDATDAKSLHTDPKTGGSRIPRLNQGAKKPQTVAVDNSSRILSERSVNEIFVSGSHRPLSKLSQEIKVHERGRNASRSLSESTASGGSVVVYSTVNHKSLSASPVKRRKETPEWKRRLVYGDLSYGEQRDLFTSRGTGLENIFKPPPAAPDPPTTRGDESSEGERISQHEVTLPSSPPTYPWDPPTVEIHVDDSVQDRSEMPERRAPTSMRYRLNDDSTDGSRESDQSLQENSYSQGESVEESALSLPREHAPGDGSRKPSSQSVVRNEDFSPILLERRLASNGETGYGPADLPPHELRKRLEKLRRNQMLIATDVSVSAVDGPAGTNGENTRDFERLGGFVNTRRGGRSDDGSFRHHMLSSALNDTSELHPEESLQASTPKRFPSVRVENWDVTDQFPTESPDYPRVPDPSPDKKAARVQGTSGSPLKLFQPYDTFTNKTLLRRLSQFQGQTTDETPSLIRPTGEPSVLSQDDGDQSYMAPPRSPTRREHGQERNISQFGVGELDGYEFNDEFSFESNGDSRLDADKENCGPEGDSMDLPRAPIFDISHDSSPPESDGLVVRRSRQKPMPSLPSRRSGRTEGAGTRSEPQASFPNDTDLLCTPQRRDTTSEIKRPRTSPSKGPTPKRRRTLHKSDVGYESMEQSQAIDSVQFSHQKMQSALGRKHIEARHDDEQELTGLGMLAPRELLRPRTPTPSQRSSVQRERPPLAEIEHAPLPPGSVRNSERKPSIRTDDFINEANKIMAMIRSKAGLASGLASLEESDAEAMQQPSPDLESSYQSTEEPFSRPPSREGRAPVARMSARQEDPDIVERLKMYEEASDMGDIIGSSMRSTAISQGALRSAREGSGEDRNRSGSNNTWPSSLEDGDVISDPPNIRLSRNPDHVDDLHDGIPSHASSGSSGQSTGRSFPTGSSRGSETRKTIAPESVEHLIPDKVGNMVLDRQRNIWIRKKSAGGSGKSRSNFLPSEASEDDPFADIPDLSVDETLELRNLMITRAENAAKLTEQNAAGSPQHTDMTITRRPTLIRPPVSSPTRREDTFQDDSEDLATPRQIDDGPVEHEIGIHEGRVSSTKRRNLTISFSSPVASIIHDMPEDCDGSVEEQSVLEQSVGDISRESIKRGRRTISIQTTKVKNSSRSRSKSQGPARRLSVRGHTVLARPISRIDEREEESTFDKLRNQQQAANMELSVVADNSSILSQDANGAQQTSLSFVVSTPAQRRGCPADDADAAPIISQYVGTFSLSPLSEFTVHHEEESLPLEASYVVGNHHLVTGDHSRRVMSMNTRELVETLADIEPFEPDWDDLRELQFRNRRLGSLHALDEFCTHLESLDASNNDIRNLSGIPSSVRQLKMTNNQLSSLTDWGHLMNLQYIDISNNGLASLAAFKNLVHLRSLRVDNNQLTSLDGIKFHDGLQTLRVRGNLIQDLDFDGSRLHRLTELDLRNNRIEHVSGLEQLPSLSSLNLEGNQLETFAVDSESPLVSLRYLRLDDNKISTLDIKLLPHLRLLHADRNRLTQISGFSRARRVDSLSLREQQGDLPLGLTHLLSRAYEVRKLYLSGNYFGGGNGDSTFAPSVDFLNLQLLELANCGLQTLPENMGFMMPNLRVLNLNLNALTDLSPLGGIPRLKRVFVSGNRLSDCAALVGTLSQFGHLTTVDVRDNPVTMGFYAPLSLTSSQGRGLIRRQSGKGDNDAEAQDDDEEQQKKTLKEAADSPFTLADQDAERDVTYCKRLDMETRMRRRVYEQMFCGACRRLKKLDGLEISGGEVAALRDGVWLALAERGYVVKANGSRVDVESCSVVAATVSGSSGDTVVGTEGDEDHVDDVEGEGVKGTEDVYVDVSERWGVEDSFGG
ncbi:hypothetical protein B0H66DRAFT_321592 [Apodospora peruviana]|uniref:Uncharacterized protein n=1 Tax=Apodospora peruviana TaxID=516989 RepID=A0AAE0HZF6_9PEZI|nr:hypothetical protein B0H66DRAFT_321592 [Apodospora peruviana]